MFGFLTSLKRLIFGSSGKNRQSVADFDDGTMKSYSAEEQKRLEELCEELFAKRDEMAAGQLQFLGLNKVKRKMGKTWPGLQKIVYKEVEEAIAKYLYPDDLYVRYKDDTYVIVFAESQADESQVKIRLITEEVKKRLFGHNQEILRDLEIDHTATMIAADDMKSAGKEDSPLDKLYRKINDDWRNGGAAKTPKPKKPDEKQKIHIMPTVEINPYTTEAQRVNAKNDNHNAPLTAALSDLIYLPLWDVRRNVLTTYIALSQPDDSTVDVLDWHEQQFQHLSASARLKKDISILQAAIKDLCAIRDGGRKLFITCPVHYDTVSHSENFQQYVLECQKIPMELKAYLVFLVLNLPGDLPAVTIKRFSLTLRSHCQALFALVPFDPELNFSALRDCRFNGLGFRMLHQGGSEKALIRRLEDFTEQAKAQFIDKIFALDIKSFSVTTSAVCSGIDYLGGAMIHDPVPKPDHVYRFKHDDLFAKMVNER